MSELRVGVNEVVSLVIPESTESWNIDKAFAEFQALKGWNMSDIDAFTGAMIALRDQFKKSSNPVQPSLTEIVASQIHEQGQIIDEYTEVKQQILGLPKFSFLSPAGGGVSRFRDQSGAWIERHEVVQAFHKHGFDTAISPTNQEI